MLPPEKRTIASLGSIAGPGRLPSARTFIIGGGLLVLVLGGYWYLNRPGDGSADRRSNAAPVRVAPVDGKTGPILVQPGNMISSSNGATAALVTIAEVRPIKISFTLPQSELPRIQARQRTQLLRATLDVRDRAGNVLAAPVDFTSNIVSNQSGTIELRATFP